MDNKTRFELLLRECWLTQTKAAEVISGITQRPLSARAVRSWLTDPTNPSHRQCPEWAINALVEYKNRPVVFEDDQSIDDLPCVGGQPKTSGAAGNAIQKFESTFPYSFEELDAALRASIEEEKKEKEDKKRSKLEKIRYRCPQCRLRVFGKADLWVVCGECRCSLEEDD
jgi:hypothetical protein